MNTEALKKYAKLYFVKQKLARKYKEVSDRLEKMELSMLDHLADLEIDKVSLKGGIMLFTRRQLWAKVRSKEDAINAIKEAGEGWMVSEGFNSNVLSKYLRELDEQGKPLPKEFEGIIETNPKYNLIAKKV